MGQTGDASVFSVPFQSSMGTPAFAAHLRLSSSLKQELQQAAAAGHSVYLRFRDGYATLTLGNREFTLQSSKETNCDVVQLPEDVLSEERCVELASIKLKLNAQRTLDDTLKSKMRAANQQQTKQRQAVMLAKGHKGSGKVTKVVTRQVTPPISSAAVSKPPVPQGLTPVLAAPKEREAPPPSLPPAHARKFLEPPRPNSKKPGGAVGQVKRALAGSPAKPISRAATPPLSGQSTPTRGLTPPPDADAGNEQPTAPAASVAVAAAARLTAQQEIPKAAVTAAASGDAQLCVVAILHVQIQHQMPKNSLQRAISEAYRLAKRKPEKKEYLQRVINGACELVHPNRMRLKPEVLETVRPKLAVAAAKKAAGGAAGAAAGAAAAKKAETAAVKKTEMAGAKSTPAASAGIGGKSGVGAVPRDTGVGAAPWDSKSVSPATTRSVSPPPRVSANAAAIAANSKPNTASPASARKLTKRKSLNALSNVSGGDALVGSAAKKNAAKPMPASTKKRAREPAAPAPGSSDTESDSGMMVIPRGGSEAPSKGPKSGPTSSEPSKKRARAAGAKPVAGGPAAGLAPAPVPAPARPSAPPPPPPLSKLPPPPQLSQMKGTVQSAVPVPPPPLSQMGAGRDAAVESNSHGGMPDDRNSAERWAGTAAPHKQKPSSWDDESSEHDARADEPASPSAHDSDGQASSDAPVMARLNNSCAAANSQQPSQLAGSRAKQNGAPVGGGSSPAPGPSPIVAPSKTAPPLSEEERLNQMIARGEIDEDDIAYARLPYATDEDAGFEADLNQYVGTSPSGPREITTVAQHAALRSEYNQKHDFYFKVHQKYCAVMSELSALQSAATAEGVSEARRKAWRDQLWALGACKFHSMCRWKEAIDNLEVELSAIRDEVTRFLASYPPPSEGGLML